MHIQRLSISNLRSFAHTELELNVPGQSGMRYPNVNVLLGGNGSGKTSVLRAAVLACLGGLLASSSGFVADSLVRKSVHDGAPLTAEVYANLCLNEFEMAGLGGQFEHLTLGCEIRKRGELEILEFARNGVEGFDIYAAEALRASPMLFEKSHPGFFILAYGANRRVEAAARVDESARMKARAGKYERVASLFEDYLGLIPLSFWLPRLQEQNPQRHAEVVALINELLPGNCQMLPQAKETEQGQDYLFSMQDIALPLRALSDGYRAHIGWVADLLFHACSLNWSAQGMQEIALREISGLVLVDEVDLHLHPEWQRTVMPTLAQALPNIQFIVTTHSPLVVASLQEANLLVLREVKTEEQTATEVCRLPEAIQGRNADDILLSPYFGLSSTRAPEVEESMHELAQRAMAGDTQAALQYLHWLSTGTAMEEAGVGA